MKLFGVELHPHSRLGNRLLILALLAVPVVYLVVGYVEDNSNLALRNMLAFLAVNALMVLVVEMPRWKSRQKLLVVMASTAAAVCILRWIGSPWV